MSEYHSLFPTQQRDGDWTEEFPLQVDPNTPPSKYTSVDVFPGQEAENMTDRLRSSAVRKPLRSSRLRSVVQVSDPGTDSLPAATTGQRSVEPPPSAAQKKQLSTIPGPLYDIPTTQSLVATLQSTIKAQQPVRGVVVIPGSRKKRLPVAEEQGSQVRLRRRVRHGAVLLAVIAIMMITFISLTPLGNGEIGSPMVNGVMNWVRTQQQEWQIMARTSDQGNQTANNPAAPAPLPPAALPTSQYVAIAQQAAASAGIPPTYFVQQINVESGFNPNAVSPSGAVGIAQMIPSTAAGIGANPYDPVSALNGAARLMAGYYKQYGDYAKALAAYNAGSGTLNYAVQAGGTNWMSFVPAETRNYIFKIMGI
jgi:hypothetical protein